MESPLALKICSPKVWSIKDDDPIISQSPRKGRVTADFEEIIIPSEKDFDIEVHKKPHFLGDDDSR